MSLLDVAKSLYIRWSGSSHDFSFLLLLLLCEIILCGGIIQFIPYTEIDWEAYMQEVEGWLGGELDYRKLRGSTGPLVYPAGFLYLFAILRQFTNNGNDIRKAQYIFALFYFITAAIVLQIYTLIYRRLANTIYGDAKTPSSSFHQGDPNDRAASALRLVLACRHGSIVSLETAAFHICPTIV